MNYSVQNLCLAVFSAFLGSVKGYLVSLVRSVGPIEIFGIRSVGSTCLILPVLVYGGCRLFYGTKDNLTLFLRSVVGNVAVCGYYFGFVHLPLAEASLFFYSTPLFTAVIGHFFLGERCGPAAAASVLLSAAGICVLCLPHLYSGNPTEISASYVVGVAGSLVGALAQAVALALVRRLTTIPPFVVSFWWALVGVLSSGLLFAILVACGSLEARMYSCGRESASLMSISAIGFLSEVSLVFSLKATDAAVVSLALTTEIVWAFLLQYFVAGDELKTTTVVGGVVIVASLLIHPMIRWCDPGDKLEKSLPGDLKVAI